MQNQESEEWEIDSDMNCLLSLFMYAKQQNRQTPSIIELEIRKRFLSNVALSHSFVFTIHALHFCLCYYYSYYRYYYCCYQAIFFCKQCT